LGWRLLGLSSGQVAVGVFFITSGFMVAASYGCNPRPLQFILVRSLRIVRAYATCLVLSALVVGALSGLTLLFFASRYLKLHHARPDLRLRLQWDLPGVFESNPKRTSVNGSFWTIPAEERMYVWVLAVGMLGLLSRRFLGNAAQLVLAAAGARVPEELPGFPVEAYDNLGGMFGLGVFALLNRDRLRASGWQFLELAVVAAWFFRATPWCPALLAVAVTSFVFWFAYRTPWRDSFASAISHTESTFGSSRCGRLSPRNSRT
jgi:peptidoglycan/LPS O-acetylase OafA/YrhL